MYWVVLALLGACASADVSWLSDHGIETDVCVDIPENNSLCWDIGYRRMRLPNFLGHDTIDEIGQQAASWLPFLNLQCHPDARLFLCSLFCPVCLDRPIHPCRTLCTVVRTGCESRMQVYGFPWPEMFNCNKFPKDNDMCIAPLTTSETKNKDDNCSVCSQVETFENILDHYCRAEIAIRTKIRHYTKQRVTAKKMKFLKGKSSQWMEPIIKLQFKEGCCNFARSHQRYLIMGNLDHGMLKPIFVMAWKMKTSQVFKRAVRMFNKFNCSDSNAISESLMTYSAIHKKHHRERKGKRKTNTIEASSP